MIKLKLVFFSIMLAIPPLLGVGAIAFYHFEEVPRLVNIENRRVQEYYRDRAAELLANPQTADYRVEKGRHFDHRLARAKKSKISGSTWGGAAVDGKYELWVRTKDGSRLVKSIDILEPTDYNLLSLIIGGSLSLLFIGFAALLVFGFWRYFHERDWFVQGVVHDLGMPVSALRGAVGYDDEEAKRLTEKLARLVHNLRAYMFSGGKRSAALLDEFDLIRLYHSAYKVFAEDFRAVNGGLDVAFKGPESLMMRADETVMSQVIWNLLSNELKYAAPYGKVEVEIREEGAFAYLRFSDYGPGLKRGELRKIFRRYYRARSQSASGFGVGLFTTRAFVRSMGGEISAKRNIPNGLVFELKIPLNR